MQPILVSQTKQMRCRDYLGYVSVDSMIPLKWIITEIVSEYVGWIHLAQDTVYLGTR